MNSITTTRTVAFVLTVVTIGYGIFEARSVMTGPELILRSPTAGSTIESPSFVVEGTAKNVTRLRINGRSVTTNQAGTFSETFVTPDGYGMLLLEAENRFGRNTRSEIAYVGKPEPSTTQE